MTIPANLYPGLNDLTDTLEELPLEASKYLTLLYEIDAKCNISLPILLNKIDTFLHNDKYGTNNPKENLRSNINDIIHMNHLLEDLMPSLEEKMHVSSIMLENMENLNNRLQLSYEIAIKNDEIDNKLRLGNNNHPAMHLHYELMDKINSTNNTANNSNTNNYVTTNPNGNNSANNNQSSNNNNNSTNINTNNSNINRSQQSLKSELRREAMIAKKKVTNSIPNGKNNNNNSNNIITNNNTNGFDNDMDNNNSNILSNKNNRTNENNTIVNDRIAAREIPHISNTQIRRNEQGERVNEFGELVYCYCNQIAYGEMVGCDGDNCELEWFHLPCIGLSNLPKGKWYCNDCLKLKK